LFWLLSVKFLITASTLYPSVILIKLSSTDVISAEIDKVSSSVTFVTTTPLVPENLND
jgi:hypothetical protein